MPSSSSGLAAPPMGGVTKQNASPFPGSRFHPLSHGAGDVVPETVPAFAPSQTCFRDRKKYGIKKTLQYKHVRYESGFYCYCRAQEKSTCDPEVSIPGCLGKVMGLPSFRQDGMDSSAFSSLLSKTGSPISNATGRHKRTPKSGKTKAAG